MPNPDDEAKRDRCRRAMNAMSNIGTFYGLTHSEVAIVSAQFIGRTIAKIPAVGLHEPTLEVSTKAMRETYAVAIARNLEAI